MGYASSVLVSLDHNALLEGYGQDMFGLQKFASNSNSYPRITFLNHMPTYDLVM